MTKYSGPGGKAFVVRIKNKEYQLIRESRIGGSSIITLSDRVLANALAKEFAACSRCRGRY
jgi:hypothetical protein